MISAEKVREYLDYSEATGFFAWKKIPSRKFKVGDAAGSLKPHGYMKIQVCGERHYSHRLAWLYITGKWPQGEMDHRDGNRANNAFNNLRESAHKQNCINRPARGTSFMAGSGRWRAQIGVELKQISLGTFGSESEAHAAYLRAVERYHGKEWMTRKAA